jgi:hypothetical protein
MCFFQAKTDSLHGFCWRQIEEKAFLWFMAMIYLGINAKRSKAIAYVRKALEMTVHGESIGTFVVTTFA